MSKENAVEFLRIASYNTEFRKQFEEVANPAEFIQVAQEQGYDFTTAELQEVVKEHSKGVLVRRKTGVWHWLRTIPWI